MGKKLKITADKILTEEKKLYKVLKVEGYTLDELPEYYTNVKFNKLEERPFVYIDNLYINLKNRNALCIYSEKQVNHLGIFTNPNGCILYEDQIIEESYMIKISQYLKLCSERLKVINKILEKTNWIGREEIIF